MKRLLRLGAALFSLVLVIGATHGSFAQSGDSPGSHNSRKPVPEGDYFCEGTNPNGSHYSGEVSIKKQGDLFKLVWKIGEYTYYGAGVQKGDTLKIQWGDNPEKLDKLVTYTVQEDGVLRGVWANGKATDVLTPYGSSEPQTSLAQSSDSPGSSSSRKPVHEGDYFCEGTNPNGSHYSGKVSIMRQGNLYKVVWKIGDSTYYGTGLPEGDTLRVRWGDHPKKFDKLVTYTVQENGVLRGVWANGKGTDVLTPDQSSGPDAPGYAMRLLLEANKLRKAATSYNEAKLALRKYEEALRVFEKLADQKHIKDVCSALGSVYADWSEYDKAAGYQERALDIAVESKDRWAESDILNSLGNSYRNWGKGEKAVYCYGRALALKAELRDSKGEGPLLNNLANVYKDNGTYDKALEYHSKALDIAVKFRQRSSEGYALHNLGLLYSDWGNFGKAIDYYEKSLAIRRELKDRINESSTINNLGSLYAGWGQYDKALDYFRDALSIRMELKDRKGEGETLMNIAQVQAHRANDKEALALYEKSLQIYSELGIPKNRIAKLIGELCLDTGEVQKADYLIKVAGYWSSLGRLHLLKSEYETAKFYYHKLLTSAEKNRNANDLFVACTGLGIASEMTGDNEGALEYYRKAIQHTEEARSTLDRTHRETFFDVRKEGFYRTAPYEGLARLLLLTYEPLDAFKASEFTKARTFAESMTRGLKGTGLNVPEDVLKEDESIRDQLSALKKQMEKAYENHNKVVIESLAPQVKSIEETRASHLRMLRDKYTLFAATKYPDPVDLSQTALRSQEWVLAYDLTDSGVIVYLVRGKGIVQALFKPVKREEVDELVRKFRQPLEIGTDGSLTQKLGAFDFAAGKKLSDLLLADILPDLPKDTPLIIVPDDSLGVLPFEMLVLNEGGKVNAGKTVPYITGAEFFGDRNPISYYQSITALTLARTLGKQRKPGVKTLAMVDPVFSTDDSRLVKMAKHEKENLLASLPKDILMSIQSQNGLTFPRLPLTAKLGDSLKKTDPQRTDLYEGMAAKKSAILEKDLTDYNSLIFATHGYFGTDLPGIQEPVLVLTLLDQPKDQDGFLRMSEVMGLKLNTDVVALTACQTGLGRQISGEGTMGMGRAFQYAGAKSVLMSLWSVAEASSVQLVESFFQHIKDGKSKLEALSLARQEIRQAGYDHPFFWAPFILVGEVE